MSLYDRRMSEPILSDNARRVLEARYLQRDAAGRIVESPAEMFRRVARSVAAAELPYGGRAAVQRWEDTFFELLTSLDFLPNSPTLMNAGTPLGQLSACFVLPVEDSIEGIFDSLKLMALIQRSGGGTGFSFSRLRPKGGHVATTGGTASGPVSFMRIFDCATDNIRQGGRRRGANMGILCVDHPDIEEFIDAKRDGHSFSNFNLSVAVDDAFMQAARDGQPYALRDPRTRQVRRVLSAADLLQRIAEAAWQTGDPGLVYFDAVNQANPAAALGAIEATNPCGEVPLLPYEACNLGSINLSHMTRLDGAAPAIDWEKLSRTVASGLRFLDDVIDVGRWPDPKIAAAVRRTRKVGLGVMGFAEMLIQLGVPYASDRAREVADELMQCIASRALSVSQELAAERGSFSAWPQSSYAERGIKVRNATRISIAPTGTIGIIADTSAGIEPLFAVAYRRCHVLGEECLLELNPLFVRYAQNHGILSPELVSELTRQGTLAGTKLSAEVKSLFQTALELSPGAHLKVQATFQRHTDNAVSKTINLPSSCTVADVRAIYQQAWEAKLKGVTVFRYGCKGDQVLTLGTGENGIEYEHFARCDPHACKL